MVSKTKKILFLLFFLGLVNAGPLSAQTEDGILEFLPAILANVEKKPPLPPPPPPAAQWRVTNLVYCPSFQSLWTVSDGEKTRSSRVTSQFITSSNTSSIATVPPGKKTFTWRLDTNAGFSTCGVFSNSFTRTLKPGYRYEFTLEPNGSGGLTISTEQSSL